MATNDKDLESGISHNSYGDANGAEGLRNQLSKTISIDADLFEKLYLGPKTKVAGDLQKRFANPTPLALLGFSVGLLPLACAYMGWRGAGGNASATITASIWFGGMLLIIAGFMEWILGNFFPFLVFMGYGGHFLTVATTFIPYYNTIQPYSADGSFQVSQGFAASFGFYPLALALLSFCYFLGALRTNLVFVLIFVAATIGFSLAAAAFWYIAAGDAVYGGKLLQGVGGCFFAADMMGWYLLFAAVIASMELPIPDLPVFDLSTVIKARPRGGHAQKVAED